VASSGAGMMPLPAASILDSFSGAFQFIFHQHDSITGARIGGLAQVWDLTLTHLEVSALALAAAVLLALPAGLLLGHWGKGELLAVSIGNAGRAIPELALIAFMVAFVGVGVVNLTIALPV